MTDRYDVAVIGAGAAGLMCAAVAGSRGRSVVVVDHAAKLAEKIRISGGGRCNFTNRTVEARHFVSRDPRFARPILDAYTPRDFTALVKRHRIAYHEKHRGQLFCDGSSEEIIAMLVAECEAGGVAWRRPVKVGDVAADRPDFRIDVDGGPIRAGRVVVATGGLSIPKIGATDFAHRLARRLGIAVVEPRPALVPFTFGGDAWQPFAALAGVALEVDAGAADPAAPRFREDLLFTHRGLSGPAALQASNYWKPGEPLDIDLAPAVDLVAALLAAKDASRQNLAPFLGALLPKRLVAQWLGSRGVADRRLAELSNAALRGIGDDLERWRPVPDGTEGFRKAEVTVGGVATAELTQDGLESRRMAGLHFIGEAVDVTGWLGGYNFQWAWASGVAAGRAA